MLSGPTSSSAQVLQKLRSWCAYQERSHFETRRKLATFKIDSETSEAVIAELISENYLNEERFAIAFSGGKFRIKKWGRIKIRQELRRHQVSDIIIKQSLELIDENDYLRTIHNLIEKRMSAIAGKRENFHQILAFLVSRGFESDLVTEEINKLLNGNG